MILIFPALIAAAIGALRGGRLRNLEELRFRQVWIPLAMLALQAVAVLIPAPREGALGSLEPWILAASYFALIIFLGVNRSLPGVKFLLAGTALNLVVMLANGGYMPVTPEALERTGHANRVITIGDQEFVRPGKDIVLEKEETHLQPLSDVIGIPKPLPFATNLSLGDVLISLGATWLVYQTVSGTKPGESQKARFVGTRLLKSSG